MIKALGRFSTRFPWVVYLTVVAITVFMVYQIKTKMYVEADLSKFLPKSMPTTKATDYYKKNYNYQESMLVGVHNSRGSVMEPDTIRVIENIVNDIKNMSGTKTFNSQLTGKKETITLPMGIDTDDINSIANLEDALLDRETGAVVTGSVVAKIKKELGIPFTDETEESLPKSEADLMRVIPQLQDHIMGDRLFSGSILSEDLKSSTIMVPMVRKWDYKRRYAILELRTALDPQLLKERFQGNESTFPFEVYDKTYGRKTYDDQFIASHTKVVARDLKTHLEGYLVDLYPDHPTLEELMNGSMNRTKFEQIMSYVDSRDFFMNPKSYSWDNFTNNLWEFALEQIDPLSRENLEFQLLNVKDIYDLNLVYEKTLKILEGYQKDHLNYYIAGSPVVTAVFSNMILKDISLLMPFAIAVIFTTLLISFRSARGVVIPLITVVVSMIWALGSMALLKVPVTAMTSMLPIVLLAVGSAYGIHLLNRYYEDIENSKDRKNVLRITVEHVGVAILMAGLTSIAGFGSLASSDLDIIKHFGIFSAVGVSYALLLTLTLSPAILRYWRLPKKQKKTEELSQKKPTIAEKLLVPIARFVLRYPKSIILVFGGLLIGSAFTLPSLEFEGGQMASLKADNPMRVSDRFLNKNLSGTGQVNLLFQFREAVNLESQWAKEELQQRFSDFSTAWDQFLTDHPETDAMEVKQLFEQFRQNLKDSKPDTQTLQEKITLFRDILNEEYSIEVSEHNMTADDASEELTDPEATESLDELSELDSESSLDDLGGMEDMADSDESSEEETNGMFSDLSEEQVEGLKNLASRLESEESRLESLGQAIIAIRESKQSESGQAMQYRFNLLQDFFAVDIKQPHVLHRVEQLYQIAKKMEGPQVEIDGQRLSPTGLISSPVDLVRKFYTVFYHNDNPQYDRLPNVQTDQLADPTMTDRSVIGVVLNQALNSSRDTFEGMISTDLTEFQLSILARDTSSAFLVQYEKALMESVSEIFPEDDPYIAKITPAGYALTINEVTSVISSSQVESIMLAFLFVFMVTFFIFRSVVGGIYSLIPLLFTVLVNFGMIYALGWKIDTSTMLVASIAIGIGVDYTIHFLERFKLQLKAGDQPDQAYFNTMATTGNAVLVNALSVSIGFLVLVFSDFVGNISMGILMAGTMVYSSLGAFVLLPAIIFVMKPKFFFSKNTTEPKRKEKNIA